MGSRAKRAFWGFLTDISGQVIITVAKFIITPIILVYTSKSSYGFWIASLSVLAYLGLMDIGLGISLTRLIAVDGHDQSDANKQNMLISSAFFSFCFVALLFLAIGLSASLYIPQWFKIPSEETSVVVQCYCLIVIAGAIALPLSTFSAVIIGFQRMMIVHCLRLVISIAGIILTIALLYKGVGILALAIAQLFNTLTIGIAAYLLCKYKYCKIIKLSVRLIRKEYLARLWSYGGYFQLARIANTIAISADATIIAFILGSVFVTPYTLTSKLAVLLSIVVASKLPIALFPALSEMFAKNEKKNLQRVVILLAHYSTRIAVTGAVFLLIANRRFVDLWVGTDVYGGTWLNVAFVTWVLLDTVFRGMGVLMQTSGQIRMLSILSICEAILNITLSLVLIRTYGLVGVAIATTIARTLTIGIWTPIFICRRIEISIWKLIWHGISSPMLKTLPGMILVIACAFIFYDINGWLWLVTLVLVILFVNLISFEGIEVLKYSRFTLRERIQRVLSLEYISGL